MDGAVMDEFEQIARDYAHLERQVAPPSPEEMERHAANLKRWREEQKRREIEAAAAAWREDYARNSGVPKIFRDRRFDSFQTISGEQRAAVEACHEFLRTWWPRMQADEHSSLWFLGPPGTGKTRLACALVTELHFEDEATVRLMTPKRLIDRLRSTWGKGAKEREGDVLQEFVDLDVLVLDDVGTSWASQAEIVQLFEVIDLRYGEGRPTLVTSNLKPPELRQVIGDRAYDRLRDGARVVPLTGESFRRPVEATL